jgi:hypothetical protein
MRSTKHLDRVIFENTRAIVELDNEDRMIDAEEETPRTREIMRERQQALAAIRAALIDLKAGGR